MFDLLLSILGGINRQINYSKISKMTLNDTALRPRVKSKCTIDIEGVNKTDHKTGRKRMQTQNKILPTQGKLS